MSKWFPWVIAVVAVALLLGVLMADQDTDWNLGIGQFSLHKGISQNSPMSRCKQRESGIEAVIASESADILRLAGEATRLQDQADATAARFTKDGIIPIPNAQDVSDCEARNSPIEWPSAPPRCSSLSNEQLRSAQDKKRELAEHEKAKAQKILERTQLQQECYGLKK